MKIDMVLVRLGAVFIVVYALNNLTHYITFLMNSPDYRLIAVFTFFLVFVLPASMAWVLWRFPATVVGSLYRAAEEQPKGEQDMQWVLLIGISLIGVYTLVFGTIDLLYFEANRYAEYKMAQAANFPGYRATPDVIAGRITNVAQVVLGTMLIYGRGGLARFLYQIRTAGVKTP